MARSLSLLCLHPLESSQLFYWEFGSRKEDPRVVWAGPGKCMLFFLQRVIYGQNPVFCMPYTSLPPHAYSSASDPQHHLKFHTLCEMDLEVEIKEEPVWLEETENNSLEHFEPESAVAHLKEGTKPEWTEQGPSQLAADIENEITVEEHAADELLPCFKEEYSVENFAVLTNGPVFSCDICSNAFIEKSQLERHMVTHSAEEVHRWTVCSIKFAQRRYLRTHRLKYPGGKPYRCSVCNCAFGQKGHLATHMVIHTGERPYRCNLCDRTYPLRSTLKKHLFLHSGERPHRCNQCNSSFALKGQLKTHILTHTGERPHHCTLCNRSFSHKPNLKRHMHTHSK